MCLGRHADRADCTGAHALGHHTFAACLRNAQAVLLSRAQPHRRGVNRSPCAHSYSYRYRHACACAYSAERRLAPLRRGSASGGYAADHYLALHGRH